MKKIITRAIILVAIYFVWFNIFYYLPSRWFKFFDNNNLLATIFTIFLYVFPLIIFYLTMMLKPIIKKHKMDTDNIIVITLGLIWSFGLYYLYIFHYGGLLLIFWFWIPLLGIMWHTIKN